MRKDWPVNEHTMTGQSGALKERPLGVELFHLPTDFDPGQHTIVRVTANEVRKKLAQHYLSENGAPHQVRIDVPPGSYRAEFRWETLAAEPAPELTAGRPAANHLVAEPHAAELATEVPAADPTVAEPRIPAHPSGFTPLVMPDTYTLEVAHQGFKTLRRTGVAVSAGDRVGLGPIMIQVGALSESVTVTAEASLLQTQSAERSATITQAEVQNIPLATRTFTNLMAVVPGVGGTSSQPARVGDSSSYSGGNANIMMDGVSTMDSGNNALAIAVNTEAIAEIKIMVSNYQAEYGRQSGVQMSAVTKSGSNHFHGTGFMIMRRSGWNATNKLDLLNGNPKAYLR